MTGYEEAVKAAGIEYRHAHARLVAAQHACDQAHEALLQAWDELVEYERRMPS